MAALQRGGIVHLQQLPHVTPNSEPTTLTKSRGLRDMAYVNTNRIARKGLLDRVLVLKDGVLAAWQQRRVYNRTVAELNALTDRELSDLGMVRVSIRDIAHEAAYGK
jgi:uncharacterized protein YjiS (DUF1127 family)